MKKAANIIFGLIIIILLVVGIFFVYQKYMQPSETLSHYIPDNALYYLEIDLSDKDFRQNLNKHPEVKQYFFDYLVEKGISSNILELDKNSIIALVQINFQEQEQKIWLIENKDIYQVQTMVPNGVYFKVLDDNVAAISESLEILNDLAQKSKEDTSNNTNPVSYLNFPAHGFMTKEYFLSNNLFSQPATIPAKDLVETLDLNNIISFGFDFENEQILFESNIGNFNQTDQSYPELFNYIPSLSYLFAVNSVNLSDALEQFLSNQDQTDLSDSGLGLKEFLAKKYSFSWYRVGEILNQPALLVIHHNKDSNMTANDLADLSNFRYSLVINNINQEQLEFVKQIFRNILAYEHPTSVPKTLPDNTTINELIADPNNVQFSIQIIKTDSDQEIPIYYYQNDNTDLALAQISNQLIISISKDAVADIVKSYKTHKETSQQQELGDCQIPSKSQIVAFNPNLVQTKLNTLFSKGVFGLTKQGVVGCWKLR